ncbi:LuxR C-terminal-related transcriptional regulator [Streptomyces albiaxialis]|uniref:LuxR C-terminal-related transcriptional regulator n=1 Tax=Streptomyces albiaxialis TaxID=329523 RepID=A0ABN2W428_9ACTN
MTLPELPAETTSFIGRTAELARIASVLDTARLVTLTGPGGVGKTRTAIRAAHGMRDRFEHGVGLVPLSALSDPELLPNTVASALHLPEQSALPAADVLAAYLADKRMLLVLDTCEHLVDACAMLCDQLLRTAPDLHIIATSRQPLDVPGEQVLPVPPLSVPAGPGESRAGEDCDALRLFTDRASAAAPGFEVTDDNRADVLSLLRRLDGIPLAIELAVSRLRTLSVEAMLGRLDHRFRLLTGGRRTTVARHQTLRTTIEWSHELSTPEERSLWARLSVFAGEFRLEAAEAVCSDDDSLAEWEVLDALIGLVEKSVVLKVETEEGARYRMLDTIREFGQEKLAETGHAAEQAVRQRHVAYFLDECGRFDAEWLTDGQAAWMRRIAHDQANLRAALEHCVATPPLACEGLSMATRLWGYWHCAGLLTEGRYWLRRTLDTCAQPCPERVKALWLSSWYMDLQGERGDNWPLLDEAEALARRLGDDRGLAWTLAFRHHTRYFRGLTDGVADGFDDARRRMDEAGDETALMMSAFFAGFFHIITGATGEGVGLCDDSLRRNAAHPAECWSRGWALWVKSVGLWLKGDHQHSVDTAREGIRVKDALRDVMGIAHFLEGFAWHAAELRHFERVAALQGAADALWRRASKEPRFGIPALHELHRHAAELARETLGSGAYHEAFNEGTKLTMDAAVRLALAENAAAPEVPPQRRGPAEGLTPRERQVAGLVAQGLTNREIAQKLVVSKRTVDSHVEHILTKLGFSARSQIVALDEEEEGA